MKIFGTLVVKNEADRYLEDCLKHMAPLFDELFIYDDQSTDITVEICKQYTDKVFIREDAIPSFIEHEGKFRQAAWDKFIEVCNPDLGDWILSFDADEFLVDLDGDTREKLQMVVDVAYRRHTSVLIPVPEVFAIKDGIPQIRVDGLWGTIAGTRLFKYQDGGTFRDKPMGCGSEPTYVAGKPFLKKEDHELKLMHFGYAHEEDQISKYERYSKLLDHGHNNEHVESIIKNKTLVPWKGVVPNGIA